MKSIIFSVILVTISLTLSGCGEDSTSLEDVENSTVVTDAVNVTDKGFPPVPQIPEDN